MDVTSRIEGEVYFVTMTVTGWIDIFTRPDYRHIIVDSLSYCQHEKGLIIYAWVLMSNHLHAILSVEGNFRVSDIIRDFKKFTSKKIFTALEMNCQESRKEWIIECFLENSTGTYSRKSARIWQEGYHPEQIYSYSFFEQKRDYIHNNPVRQEIVAHPEDYLYSSAVDYSGGKGLLDVCIA